MPLDATPRPDVLSLEGLIEWLETQDPAKRYDYTNPRDCLLCRYFRTGGIPVEGLSLGGYSLLVQGGYFKYPEILADVSVGKPWTYGDALARARAML